MSRVTVNSAKRFELWRRAVPLGIKASLVAGTLLLGGCASYQKDHVIVGSVPGDYRTKHPIIVSDAEVSEDLVVGKSMRGMSFRHRNVVYGLIGRFKRTNAQYFNILVPAGSPNEAAARRVATNVVDALAKNGISRERVIVSRYQAHNHADAATVRLSFTAMTANVASKCGEWSDDLGRTHENRNYENFGCATQNNLATIVANPEDLLGPRGESEIDASRRDKVINDWRESGSPNLPSLL